MLAFLVPSLPPFGHASIVPPSLCMCACQLEGLAADTPPDDRNPPLQFPIIGVCLTCTHTRLLPFTMCCTRERGAEREGGYAHEPPPC